MLPCGRGGYKTNWMAMERIGTLSDREEQIRVDVESQS